MITVQKAQQIIFNLQKDFGTELIPLHKSVGRVLREDLFADRDFPPYNRVTMDGICIRHAAFEEGVREFSIEGIAPAGAPQMTLSGKNKCLEVMTGSILPLEADAVIRYEDLQIENGIARVNLDDLDFWKNIHSKGEDREKDSKVIAAGRVISAAEVGVAATIGKAQVLVSKLPKILIISTGDELVDINESPEAHQIRRSNVYRLQSTLQHYGVPADTAHLDDNLEEIKKALGEFMGNYDVLILSGGVSKGKFDFLPEALEAQGVKKLFHKIKQRPGKPFWFGQHPGGTLVFALPGNPVSSFLGTYCYFLPWLKKSLGMEKAPQPMAVLTKNIYFKPDLTYFAQVKLSYSPEGKLLARPVKGHGSGDLANLVDADAFLQIPRGKDQFEAGEVFPVIHFR